VSKKDNDTINIANLFRFIKKYFLFVVISSILGFVISYIYVYFKPNIYRATTTMLINKEKTSFSSKEDFLKSAFGQGVSDIDTELLILKSESILSLALKQVDYQYRYYGIKNYKKVELFDKSPILVDIKKGFNIRFKLNIIDNNRFKLIAKGKDSSGKKWKYNNIHSFNKEIKNRYFDFTVKKVGKLNYKSYEFEILDKQHTLAYVKDMLNVNPVKSGSSLISISIEDTIPQRAAEFVNTLTDEYLKESIKRKTKQATLKLNFIDEQLKKITDALKGTELELERLKSKSNSVATTSKRSVDVKVEIEKLNLEKKVITTLLNQIKRGKSIENIAIIGVENSNSILALISNLQKAIVQKKALLQEFTPMHPEVIKVNATIKELKRSIYQGLKNTLLVIKEKEKALKAQYNKEQQKIAKLPELERKLSELKRNYLVNEKIYTILLEKRSEISFAKASTINQNRVIDKAKVPQKPIKPKRKIVYMVGTILGFVFGTFIAYIHYLLSSKILYKKDIINITNQEPIIEIPCISSYKKGNLLVLNSKYEQAVNAFRELRINLRYILDKKSMVISVISYDEQEGKSLVSANLATSMALSGKSVLLIDMGFANPALNDYFGVDTANGIGDYLNDDLIYSSIINSTNISNLDLIIAGNYDVGTIGEKIDNKKIEELLSQIKKFYDVIIIDTSAFKNSVENKVIIDLSDISLFVVRYNHSKRENLEKLNKLKKENSKREFAIVFNCAKKETI